MKGFKFALLAGAAGAMALTGSAFVTSGASAAEVDGPKVRWKYNVWGKKRAFTAGVEEVAKIVSEKTGGKFQIKVFYGDQLGGKKQNLDNIKAGVFEMAQICWAYHPGKVQSMMVMNLPFLPIASASAQQRVAEAVYNHPIPKKEIADKWGAMIYMSSLLPQYELMGRGKPPEQITDFKGMTLRSLGGLADAMRALGANISTMTATEVYQALDRGAVSAVSFPFSYAYAAYKLDEVANWYTINLSPGTNDCPTIASQKAFNALPEQYQKLLMDAKEPAYKVLAAGYKQKDDVNIPNFRKKLKEIKYTDAELEKFRKLGGQPVWDAWVAKNKDKFDSQALLDFVLKQAAGS